MSAVCTNKQNNSVIIDGDDFAVGVMITLQVAGERDYLKNCICFFFCSLLWQGVGNLFLFRIEILFKSIKISS